ncbi:hypothetical protein FQV39_29785 (plasmid) [Bosea sp. F3-2]|uniref:hypothetical protein n=1 Tax=Bosea sp. F3-2 TaxID=2599640 RepID=UPI0011F00071|nr:hypothetical protein [Bosea sp. F3-2]QEL26863.1 hypothetical protein FQV39_29785 [Bosea sp. F3-2]
MREIEHRNEDQTPPRPGSGQVSVNYSAWEVFEEGDGFGREWIIRGLNGRDDIVTVEIAVSKDRVVTITVAPGFRETEVRALAQLQVESRPPAPFVRLLHRQIADRGATIFAPIDEAGLQVMLEALSQGAGMQLTLVSAKGEALQAPLDNDPSFQEVFRLATSSARQQ